MQSEYPHFIVSSKHPLHTVAAANTVAAERNTSCITPAAAVVVGIDHSLILILL